MSGTTAQATIVGNIGHDLVLRYTQHGTAVLNMNLAVHEQRNGQQVTHWLKASVFGTQAEAAKQNLSKGSKVAVAGALKTWRIENSKGGTRVITYVEGTSIEFM